MIKNIAFLCLLVTTTSSFAQYYKTYDWAENPTIHEISAEDANESSIGILKKHIVEYASGDSDQIPRRFETEHTIARVNDDKGIAQHNTVYIPMYDVKTVVDIKARTINSKGKITLLNQDNIKEVKNVDEYGDFKIFAIEGVEKNSEIEVLYTVEKEFDMYGSETLQTDYKIKKSQFLFIAGALNSNIKAYRTTSNFEYVKVNGKDEKLLTITDVPAMIDEEYSTPKANKIAVVYQCFPNGQNITQQMFWNNVANNVGNRFFAENVVKKAQTDVDKIIEGQSDLSDFKKAMLIDNFVKTNFTIVKNNNEELSDLDYILENRSSSDFGIMKVYGQYLKALDVDYEIVVTANRFLNKFDPEFFIPGMLRDFLIYLPSEKKYIAPDRIEARVGEAPFNILGNYGLFIPSDFDYYFSKIVEEDPDFSRIKRDMDISIDDDFEKVTIIEDQEYYGHWAETSRAVLNLSSEENIKEYKDYLTGAGIEDKEILSYSEANADINQVNYNLPFKVKSTISSESLLEDAGDSYIFQVGLVIGTQSELYQETERINPIEMTYPNRYNYEIIVHIPEGYSVEGLSSLNINKSYIGRTGEKLAKFESSYKKEGDKIIITIEEFYKTHEFSVSKYEDFRGVINAASDFNKAAILFKATE
ncbi:hypothetical protein [Psychroserpens algicola]|uniref:DUF3857 domain-containing protein n=1 Tax=Psychroserpens algicola TaxID=1719034 RepID=A0ABT0H8R3_9FLAO|nr:hypothetical protein [Psychroserpens algicola]MCK8480755.1 hypothetical protein [Psychroserpens algicola]